MKLNRLSIIFLSLFVIALFSCKEAASYEDIIYITGTDKTPKIDLAVDGPKEIALTATASKQAAVDSKIKFEVAAAALKDYNASTGKNYILPPEGSFELSTNYVALKKGEHISDQVKLSILSVDEFDDGASYCIPIQLTEVTGDNIKILEKSNTAFVVIKRIIVTKAVELTGYDLHVPQFQTDPMVKDMDAVTMECSFKVNRFSWINSVMGIEENFLMRCVDWDEDGSYNFEMGPIIVGGKKYMHAATTDLEAGKWYHVAIVSTGSKTILYINGQVDSEFGGRSGKVNFNVDYFGGFHLGSSCDARYLNGSISEARIWKRALTAAEIQENLCYVDPTSEGLVAYWRLDTAQEDGTIRDETGHGFDATPRGGLRFENNIRCPF